jgi:multidrug efflux pump subunit AcrA (membrane-fusion protein)
VKSYLLQFNQRAAVVTVTVAAIATAVLLSGCGRPADANAPQESSSTSKTSDSPQSEATVELSSGQLNAIKIEPVGTYLFPVEKEAVGSIAYHEEDTARDAQPGSAPVPDLATHPPTEWLVANISEIDSPLIHVEQPVRAKVVAYPDRVFNGKVSALGGTVWDSGGNPAVDPNTHRITVRCEIADPKNELYPGMLATIVIQVQKPVESVAIPVDGVVREGDGTMTAWVTADRQHFVQRIIKIGLQSDGQYQVLEGLHNGELVVTDGAVFLDNMLQAPSDD